MYVPPVLTFLVSFQNLQHRLVIVKASSGPRYVVSFRPTLPVAKLKAGTRVSLDMTTLTIMRILPREVDPMVYKMSLEDPGGASFAGIGGLGEQVRELREVIELPLMNPELFIRVGINPPKGVLLYGPPGTGKTLLARAVAATLNTNFLKVVSSAIVDKYIGESARVVREMFGYAREHEPCVIFMDEIDAIGGRRFSEGTSADREIQRTLMEVRSRSAFSLGSQLFTPAQLLNQMDGFDSLGQTKLIMATNRPDTLDPALLRPGRLDRKIEIPLPNEQARLEILKIHAAPVNKGGEIDYDAVVKVGSLPLGLLRRTDRHQVIRRLQRCRPSQRHYRIRNVRHQGREVSLARGCDLMVALSTIPPRDYVHQEDLMKAARKVGDAKKHECTFLPSPPPQRKFYDPIRSKTRVHGLIRSSPSVYTPFSHPGPPVFRCTESSYPKVPWSVYRKP